MEIDVLFFKFYSLKESVNTEYIGCITDKLGFAVPYLNYSAYICLCIEMWKFLHVHFKILHVLILIEVWQ